jgi:hypothetical protein
MTKFSLKDIRKKSLGELYKKTELPKETLEEIKKIGDENFEKLVKDKYPLEEEKEKQEGESEILLECYRNIVDILKKYCDLKEEYYSLVAIWIIGTYFHNQFISYPYLFFNAMKGSGKSRILKLIAVLSYEGDMLNSLTEAVLFRTKGTLCIDEFEGMGKKGNESLRELLNSAYKKGTKVKRMKKKKTIDGEEQVVEEFDVFRPICIANIWGMDSVLGDRCISLILEKSSKKSITRLVEIFENEEITIKTKKKLHPIKTKFSKGKEQKGVVSVDVVSVGNVYKEWNDMIRSQKQNYTYYTNNINNTNYTNYTFLNKLRKLDIEGRDLELAMPLFIIANKIDEKTLNDLINTFKIIVQERKEEDVVENTDVSLIDFVSQETSESYFVSITELVRKFREFLQVNDEWINTRWLGRALKRLNLIKEKKRKKRGIEIILNIKKAQEKIKMFK